MAERKWQPWVQFKDEPELLPISEPPCKDCKFWKPHRSFTREGIFDGVVLCTNIGEMHADFSCFKSRTT